MIIWLASYPKSGNTWIRTIINQILNNDLINNNEVFDDLLKIRRYPTQKDITGLPQIISKTNDTKNKKKELIECTVKNWIPSQKKINLNNKVNIFKTHNMLCEIDLNGNKYAFTDENNTLGVIHIVRDPRNLVTSLKSHFSHTTDEETVEMLNYKFSWTGFTENEVPQLLSSWQNHYNSWKKFPKNNLLVRYEDILTNTKNEIYKLSSYLSNFFKLQLSDKKMERIISNTSFENFKEQEIKGNFKENSFNKKTGKKNIFFNLGPKNDWKKILNRKHANLIEKNFYSEMKELNYL
tara:strand:- start:155 stop:1036 length:882 start_codon:yes stop_codon:yes gene_type:complete